MALGLIAVKPAQNVADDLGAAAVHGYHMALEDVPADLLMLAAKRALKDTANKFRPGPGEMLGYIEADLKDRRRRQQRLSVFAVTTPTDDHRVDTNRGLKLAQEAAERIAVNRKPDGSSPTFQEVAAVRPALTPSVSGNDASEGLKELARKMGAIA